MTQRTLASVLAVLLLAAPAAADISFIGSACNSASPNGTFSVTLPGGLQADDLIICAFAVGDSPGADTDLSATGYTEMADQAQTADTNDTEMWTGYRFFVGGDTACPTSGTFTAIGGTNASNTACVMVFRGVATVAQGGPFDGAGAGANGQDSSNANPGSADHSAAAGNWAFIAGSTGHTGGATAAYTAPTNYTTNFAQDPHDDTVDVLIGVGYREDAIADPEDPGAMTAANIGTAANNSWLAITAILKAAPAVTCTAGLNMTLLGVGGCP